ncbi:MAG: error-prone DNA polymerase, partial [Pseudomonadota bacterium]
DARKNGVTVREVDVSFSFAQNTLEEKVGEHCAVRLGFRQIDGFHWLDEDEERLKALQSSFSDAQLRIVGTRSMGVPESGTHDRMGSLPPCGGELERGVSHDHRPCDLPLSLTLPRKGGGNPPTSRAALDQMRVSTEQDWADRIVAARNRRPFTSLEDFARDTALPKRALILLADADAFRSLGLDRREALWAVRRLPDDVPLPLFEAATAREQPDEGAKPLPEMPRPEQVVADYQTIRLSLKGHPMEFLREMFTKERVVACHTINRSNDRRRVRCAGVVLVRQRPGSAKGVVFMTLEDETGIANIVVWPKVMEQYRKEVMGARLILVEGYIQSSPEGVTHLVAQRMTDRSHDLIGLANDSAVSKHPVPAGPALIEPLNDDRRDHGDNSSQRIRHPRNVRILPPSRDFH